MHYRNNWKFAAALSLALFCACIPSVRGQEAAGEEKVQQIQLTTDSVKRFIDAFEDIKKWQKANEPTGATSEEGDDEDASENTFSAIQGAQNSEQMKAMLKKHGFDDLDVWGQTAQSVMLAYGYADPEGGLVDYESNVKKSIDQIKQDTELTEVEKKEAIQNLESEYKSVADMKPLQSNIDVVKPFVPQIKKMVESD